MTSSSALILYQFVFATMLPVLASVLFTSLEGKGTFAKIGYWPKQILIGVAFGAIAVYGTEVGIVTHDATMNVRDAAPLVAGLYFGGPAGIIAGIIGGVERWFAALWGRGMFTRLACSLATTLAGFYAAALRHFLFDRKNPGWILAFATGIVAEVLHLLLVFITNVDNTARAFIVVDACTVPMVTCTALSVAMSGMAINLMDGRGLLRRGELPDISKRVQTGLLGVAVLGFAGTVGFAAILGTSLSTSRSKDTLSITLQDIEQDIRDTSNQNLLSLAYVAAREIPSVEDATQEKVDDLVSSMALTEIHIIDDRGIIVLSSDPSYVGFDMSDGEQSAEFLALLPGGTASQVVQDYQPISMDSNIWRKYAGVRIKGGFLQVGYDAEFFVVDLADQIRFTVANRHVGNDGFLTVLTERGALVGTRSDVTMDYHDVQGLSAAMEGMKEGELFELTFHGNEYYALYRKTEGMHVMAMLPLSEAQEERNISALVTSFMEVIVLAALFAGMYLLIKRIVVDSIWQVNGRLEEITAGDLRVEVDVRDSSEFDLLSDGINDTVSALRDAISAESARIERDLMTAKAIQESALPRVFPPFPDVDAFDIYATMNAAREVGGDFYDFFMVDDHTLGFLIADVSGKGIPASLFMMSAKTELANTIKTGMDLAEAVRTTNESICCANDAGMFVTVWAAVLNFETGELTYVNAGHNPPLLRHGGIWQWLREKGGLFLGTFETAKYRSNTIKLVSGDELVLYTDGVTEAFSVSGEQYGDERLISFLDEHNNLHARELVEALNDDVEQWFEGAEQSDDITILSLEYGVPPQGVAPTGCPCEK